MNGQTRRTLSALAAVLLIPLPGLAVAAPSRATQAPRASVYAGTWSGTTGQDKDLTFRGEQPRAGHLPAGRLVRRRGRVPDRGDDDDEVALGPDQHPQEVPGPHPDGQHLPRGGRTDAVEGQVQRLPQVTVVDTTGYGCSGSAGRAGPPARALPERHVGSRDVGSADRRTGRHHDRGDGCSILMTSRSEEADHPPPQGARPEPDREAGRDVEGSRPATTLLDQPNGLEAERREGRQRTAEAGADQVSTRSARPAPAPRAADRASTNEPTTLTVKVPHGKTLSCRDWTRRSVR